MYWISLALIAPLFWAASNFIDKYILKKNTKGVVDFLFFSSLITWPFFIVLVLWFGMPAITSDAWIPLLTGAWLLYSYGFYAKVLERTDASAMVILYTLIPVITVALAFIFLGQTLSSRELLGFFIVVGGAIVVSLQKHGRMDRRDFGMIFIAMVMWSGMVLVVDFGLTKISFWDYFILDTLGSALAGLGLLIIPTMRQRIINGLRTANINKYLWYASNNALDFLGQMASKKALAIAPSAALVVVVAQVQSFYAIIIGALLTLLLPGVITENISFRTLAQKCVGAAVMFAGVYVLLT